MFYNFKIFLFVFFVFFSSSLFADSQHIEDVLSEEQVEIPLKQALGENIYDEIIKSNKYRYVGNSKCRLCHRGFFIGRKNDLHDFTMQKLVQSGHDKNDKCLVCHSTGHGVKSGFVNMEETPRLSNVQCEGCHGPGNLHVKLAKEQVRLKLKGDVKGFLMGKDDSEKLKKMCISCHTNRWNKSYHNLEESYDSYKYADPNKRK